MWGADSLVAAGAQPSLDPFPRHLRHGFVSRGCKENPNLPEWSALRVIVCRL